MTYLAFLIERIKAATKRLNSAEATVEYFDSCLTNSVCREAVADATERADRAYLDLIEAEEALDHYLEGQPTSEEAAAGRQDPEVQARLVAAKAEADAKAKAEADMKWFAACDAREAVAAAKRAEKAEAAKAEAEKFANIALAAGWQGNDIFSLAIEGKKIAKAEADAKAIAEAAAKAAAKSEAATKAKIEAEKAAEAARIERERISAEKAEAAKAEAKANRERVSAALSAVTKAPVTTKTPETTKAPVTTKNPETTKAPETKSGLKAILSAIGSAVAAFVTMIVAFFTGIGLKCKLRHAGKKLIAKKAEFSAQQGNVSPFAIVVRRSTKWMKRTWNKIQSRTQFNNWASLMAHSFEPIGLREARKASIATATLGHPSSGKFERKIIALPDDLNISKYIRSIAKGDYKQIYFRDASGKLYILAHNDGNALVGEVKQLTGINDGEHATLITCHADKIDAKGELCVRANYLGIDCAVDVSVEGNNLIVVRHDDIIPYEAKTYCRAFCEGYFTEKRIEMYRNKLAKLAFAIHHLTERIRNASSEWEGYRDENGEPITSAMVKADRKELAETKAEVAKFCERVSEDICPVIVTCDDEGNVSFVWFIPNEKEWTTLGWWDGEGDGRRSADYDTPSEVRDFEKATDAIIEKHGLEGAIKALQEARSPLKVNITGWIYSYLNIQSFADVLFKRSGKTPAEFATEMVSKGMNPDEIWKAVGKLGDDEFVQILDLIGPTYVLGTQLTFDQKDACSCRKGHFNQLYSWIGYGHYRPEVVSRVLKKTEFILKGEEWLRYGSDRAEDAEEALKLALHEGATVTMSQEDFDNLPIDIQEVVARVLPGYHSELAKLGYPDFYRVNQIPGHCGEYTWTYVIAQDGSLRPADYCEVIRRANGKPMTGNFNCIWKQIQPGDAIFNISAYGMKNPIKFKWDLVPQWLSAEQLRTAQQLVRGEFAGEENRWFVNWGPETDYSQWVEELFKAPQVKVDTFDERPIVDELGDSVHPVEWDELENDLDEGLKKQIFKLPGTFGGLQFFAAHPSKAQLYGYALKKEAEAARKYYEETEVVDLCFYYNKIAMVLSDGRKVSIGDAVKAVFGNGLEYSNTLLVYLRNVWKAQTMSIGAQAYQTFAWNHHYNIKQNVKFICDYNEVRNWLEEASKDWFAEPASDIFYYPMNPNEDMVYKTITDHFGNEWIGYRKADNPSVQEWAHYKRFLNAKGIWVYDNGSLHGREVCATLGIERSARGNVGIETKYGVLSIGGDVSYYFGDGMAADNAIFEFLKGHFDLREITVENEPYIHCNRNEIFAWFKTVEEKWEKEKSYYQWLVSINARRPDERENVPFYYVAEVENGMKMVYLMDRHGIAHKAWRKEDGSKCLGYNQRCYVSEYGTYRKVWEDIPSPKAILGNADSAEAHANRFDREIVYIDDGIVDEMNSAIADISIGDYKRVAFTDTCGRSYLLGHNDGRGLVGELKVLSEGYNADKAIVITCDADKLAGVNNQLCLNGTVEVEIESNRYENILWIRRYDEIMPQAVKDTIFDFYNKAGVFDAEGDDVGDKIAEGLRTRLDGALFQVNHLMKQVTHAETEWAGYRDENGDPIAPAMRRRAERELPSAKRVLDKLCKEFEEYMIIVKAVIGIDEFGNESMCLDWHILNNVAILGYSQTAIDNETNVSPEKETGNIYKEVSGMKDQNLIKRVSATAELMTIKGDLIVERQRVDDAITKVKATIRRLRRLVVAESGEMAGIKGYGRKRVELANGFASEGKTRHAEEVMTEVNRLVELYVDASSMHEFYSKELEDKLGVLKQLEMYRKDIVAAINEAEAAEAEGKEVDDPTRDVTDFEAVIERGQDFVIRDELSDGQGRIVEGGKIIEIGAFKQLTARTFAYPNAKASGNLKKISISVKNGTFKVPGFKAIETADKGASRVYAVKDAAEATRLLKSARFTTDLDCFEEIVINYELGELKLKPNVLKTVEVKEVSSEDLEAKAVAEAEAEARKDKAQDLINKKLGYKSELEFQSFEARTDYKVQFVSMYGNADMKDNAAKAVEEVELERAKAAKQSIDEVNAAEKAAGIFLSYIFMSNEDKKTEKGYALSSLEACYVMYLKKVRNMRNELEEAQVNMRSEQLKNFDSKRITSAQQKVDSLQNKLQPAETELCEIYDDLCKAAVKAKVVISKEVRDLIMAEEHISAKRKALKPLSEASAKATKAYNEAVKGEDEALIAKANEALKAANKALFDAKGEFAKAIRAYDEAFSLCIKCVRAYKTITLSFTSEEMNDKVISLGKAAFKDMDALIHWLNGYNRGPKITIKTKSGLREVQDAQSEADRAALSDIRRKGFAAGLLSKLVDETVDKDGNAKLVKGVRNVDTATAVVGYFGDVLSDYAEESTNRIAAVNELLDKKLENGKTIRDYLEYFKQQREKRATARAVDRYYYSENVGVTSARFQLDRDYQALKEARYGRDEEIVSLLDETDEYVQKLFARDMAYVNAQSKASQVIWAFVACCLNNNRILTLINGIKDEFAAAHPGVNINISRWAAFMHPAIWDAWHVMNLIRNEINYRHNGSQIAFVNAVLKFCAIIQKYDKGVRGSGSAWAHNIGAIARMAEFDADSIYNALDEKNERGQTLYGQIELAFASNGTKSPTKTVVRSIVEHRVPSTGQLAEAGKYGEYDGAHGNTAALELIDGDAELGGKKSYRNLNFDNIKETIALGCVDFEVAREKVVSTINLDGSLIVWYGNLICEKAADFGSSIFGAMSVWKDALASEDHKMPWESCPIGGLEPGNKDFDEAYEERFSKATCTSPEDLVIFEDWINSVCKDWLEFKKFEEEVFEPAKEAYEQAKRDNQNHNGAETILNMALEAAEFEYNNAKDQLDAMYEICLEQGRSEYLMKILVGDRYDTYDDVAKTNQYIRDINNG